MYTAARTLFDKEVEKDKRMGHLILLARNNQGYRNLMKIVSEGYRHGFYYKPRIDKDVLRKYHEGIIALSACLAGEVQHRLLNGDYDGARREALEMRDIFGEDSFYLELQDQGLEEEARILRHSSSGTSVRLMVLASTSMVPSLGSHTTFAPRCCRLPTTFLLG